MDRSSESPSRLRRTFLDLSDEIFERVEQSSMLVAMGWSGAVGWDDLLKSRRVLLVSEAGSGKTHECRAEQKRLLGAGEPAFLIELAELATNNLRDLLSAEERARLDAWHASQSDVATFFLDSIDELNLTRRSFKTALTRFENAVTGQLGRVKVVITTRPVEFDRALIQERLPVPQEPEPPATAEAFADIAMCRARDPFENKKAAPPPDLRTVALMPLSDEQIREMASLQGVTDAETLLRDIRQHNAEEFARRPQDLIELCAGWRAHRRIGTHREQVESNIEIKLKARTDRPERAALSLDKACEGAGRLALAALLTRKLSIRHSAEADRDGEPGSALEPQAILTDWSDEERRTLLERALFGFASYGRVRFHHQSVIEFLAADRLKTLLHAGMSIKAIKRLLFAETPQGIKVVKPSIRPVAAWLALEEPSIYDEILSREPDVLLNHGDPESITPEQRVRALRAYVERYRLGGWRGMHVPHVQVHRFASDELTAEVLRLWDEGIENPEVRELLLELIAAVPMRDCADIAFMVVMNGDAELGERMSALDALTALEDARLEAVVRSLESDPNRWGNRLITASVLKLFPAHLPVETLFRILPRIEESRHSVGGLSWSWTRLIAEADMAPGYLDALRDGLTELVWSDGQPRDGSPHVVSPKPHFIAPLAAACLRQLKQGIASAAVVQSSVVALRFARDEYSRHEPVAELHEILAASGATVREAAFWALDALNQSICPQDDPWRRLYEANDYGAIRLNEPQDGTWVMASLCDPNRSLAERSVMLEAAMLGVCDRLGDFRERLLELKGRVAHCPELVDRIEDRLKPTPVRREIATWQAKEEKRRKQAERREAKDRASWIQFWRFVASDPEEAFSADRLDNTVWNLWNVMARVGERSRASGWNRRFMEQYFGKDTADRMREAMMPVWRRHRPMLRSERPDHERQSYPTVWFLGLAAIAAEAEDPSSARRLSCEEAGLAARYAPLELNSFPSWMENLVAAYPGTVETVLGAELIAELDEPVTASGYSAMLQHIGHAAPDVARVFLPRLRAWLNTNAQHLPEGANPDRTAERLQSVVEALLKFGDIRMQDDIRDLAVRVLDDGPDPHFETVWLPTLMRLNPAAGVEWLEQRLIGITPELLGPGASWIAQLFSDRHNEILVNPRAPGFTPALLLRLVRLAYHHVRPADDISHEGVYHPGPRDHAQQGRGALLNALLGAVGPEAWAAKLELAGDSDHTDFRDRLLAIAREKAAEETDGATLSESEVVALDRNREAPPATRDEMFALLLDRLDDLDDLLLRDDSPRAAWAGIADERAMRQVIAHELKSTANGAYTVDQEGVTADEKKTDIRLRAASSDQEAVIELKIGEKPRSGRDLRDTLKNQLVTKYMAPENCRAGCLLVTVANDRTWQHPDSEEPLDVAGLEAMLRAEASRIVAELGFVLRLTVRVLDLRPRLPTEKVNNAAAAEAARGTTAMSDGRI